MSKQRMSFAHVIGLIVTTGLTLFLFYLSRFWIWVAPWANDGLFGLKLFSPYGSNVSWWLRGTWLKDFDMLIWVCGAIVLLSVLHWISSKVSGIWSSNEP
ncbi:MAG: hypothetical protein AAF732_06940 [Pseudomonadota bacterium]